jgi:nucleoside-diphosphate-sugar epimerase
LVTGGNGAVGCNLVRQLLKLSCSIVVLDDFSQSKRGNLPYDKKIKLIHGDITDEKTLRKTFATKYNYVFHLAARFANEMSVMNPIEDLLVNTQGTLQMLLHTAKQKTDRFVYTSSSSIYGSQKKLIFDETLYPNPSTPYAASKLSAEHYCNAIKELYGLDYTIVRLSNSYGPFDPPGKFRNVIPNFFAAAIHNKPLTITGTGKETRDFTFIGDTVQGILLAAAEPRAKNETFNLGTGKETEILKIAKLITQITNSKSKIVFKPMRSFDHIKRRRMDIGKAKRILGYSYKISISEGLQITHNWFQKQVV